MNLKIKKKSRSIFNKNKGDIDFEKYEIIKKIIGNFIYKHKKDYNVSYDELLHDITLEIILRISNFNEEYISNKGGNKEKLFNNWCISNARWLQTDKYMLKKYIKTKEIIEINNEENIENIDISYNNNYLNEYNKNNLDINNMNLIILLEKLYKNKEIDLNMFIIGKLISEGYSRKEIAKQMGFSLVNFNNSYFKKFRIILEKYKNII